MKPADTKPSRSPSKAEKRTPSRAKPADQKIITGADLAAQLMEELDG
ncbi:hypothetical protein ACRS3X_06360 [Ectopseudomonas hydrolytica]|jgi:hypothetical protein